MEIRIGPDAEEDGFREHVGCSEVFSRVEKGACCDCFDGCDGECALESFLGTLVCGDHVVVAVVELAEIGPPPEVCCCVGCDQPVDISV